ncbi:unnamed protein product [Prorocentrum cordatum]|uniref:Uncharacterized protein n=1 Tax=Prorocentrum cordatum TaxID=2364126 RepID=A0ABN9PWN6_9DINO|nr:unnamed protein product [Polarella glacialis]
MRSRLVNPDPRNVRALLRGGLRALWLCGLPERAAAKSEGSDGLCMEELCDTVTAPASNPDCGKSFCSACPICSESIGEAGQTLGPDGQPDGKMCIRVVCDQVGDPCSDPSVAASCSGCAECK